MPSSSLKNLLTSQAQAVEKELEFPFYSLQWRTWAACYIQSAWRRHCSRKKEKILEEKNKRMQDGLATGSETSTLSVGASIYVSRFATNALLILRWNRIYNAQVSTRMLDVTLQKPAQPNFDDDAAFLTFRPVWLGSFESDGPVLGVWAVGPQTHHR
ncbi:cyclic nucleotide-gated ion channel 1-like [Bidens hawaiensis]|uniref:cyclic nucleotide-gated ion channel 1-like n=1 Tax=Bidens hawaiensis TaxID=980011 RepID=UPI00404A9A15